MSKVRGGLGRGLEALIPVTRRPDSGEAVQVDLDRIEPNPYQPRRDWNEEELRDLTTSIREHGILQPVVVCPADGDGSAQYTLVAGERRWRAARLAGLARIPAVVKQVSPQQMLALALVENLQRSNLNPLEEAYAYRQLMQQFDLTQEKVATIVGRSRAAVANVLRLLSLPEEIQASLSRGEISEGHARALLSLKDDGERQKLWQTVLAQGLSVRDAERVARDGMRAAGTTAARPEKTNEPAPPLDKALENDFRAALGTRVNLVRQGERGRLVVHFYSDEQLHALYERLTRE